MRRAVGSVRATGRGRWIVQVSAGEAQGRRRRLTRRVAGSRADAERVYAELLAASGSPPPAARRVTVAAFCDQWLEARRGRIRARTWEGYAGVVRRYVRPWLGHLDLRRLSPRDVDAWLAALAREGGADGGPLSPATIRTAHRVLSTVCGQAVRWRILERSPMDGVDAPSVPRFQAAALDVDVAARILAAATGGELELPTVLALGAGLRRSELCGLAWRDVDLEAGTVAVRQTLHEPSGGLRFEEPKSQRSRRTIAIAAPVAAALRARRVAAAEAALARGRRLELDELVLADVDGRPMRPDRVSRAFRRLADDVDAPGVRFHDLRHWHATIGIAATGQLVAMSRRLGHATAAFTADVYAQAPAALDRELADAIAAIIAGVPGSAAAQRGVEPD